MKVRPVTLTEWLRHIGAVHHRSIDMSLTRVGDVLQRLGLDTFKFRVISVAGTNGKGSSVAMLASVLRAAGFVVATYTSPHLTHYRERIYCGHGFPTDSELCAVLAEIDAARGKIPLTYFEFSTLAALLLFHRSPVDVAVLEVGMGGRLDAVNAVDADVALIASIGLDHIQWLGPDRESIGFEKAGILRPGRAAVCADPDTPRSVLEHARRIGAPLYRLGEDFTYADEGNGTWIWRGPGDEHLRLPHPALPGRIQLQNASGVVMTLRCFAGPHPIGRQALDAGLRQVELAGRFQVIQSHCELVLDVAHNLDAAHVLQDNLATLPPKRTVAVCAMLRDKPFGAIAEVLGAQIERWYLAPLHDSRGARAEQLLRRLAPGLGLAFPSVSDAFEQACRDAGPQDRIVVFGSFHTVGDILAQLQSVIHTPAT